MTIYSTVRAMQLYHLKTPDQLSPSNVALGKSILARDAYDPLHEWCCDVFRFAGKDCLTMVNCVSNLTFFLFNVRKEHMDNIGNILVQHMTDLYAGDVEMGSSMKNMFREDKYAVFTPLRSRSMSAAISHMFNACAKGGNLFYDYIDYNNVLHMRQIDYDINFSHFLTRMENGEKVRYSPGARFREIVTARYGNQPHL